MQRNWDVVQRVLLAVERLDDHQSIGRVFPEIVFENKFREDEESKSILFHYKLLLDSGFIKGAVGPTWTIVGLTWDGHDLLERLRKS